MVIPLCSEKTIFVYNNIYLTYYGDILNLKTMSNQPQDY